MDFIRNLKRYMVGDDVKYVKDKLVSLGYLKKSTHSRYGNDTYRAVKAFQNASNLEPDGIVGILTWTALFDDQKPQPVIPIPNYIAEPARSEIAIALAGTTAKRREICLNALQFCVDRNMKPAIMRGFYIRGGNLYRKDLSLNVMTEARLNSYFRKSQYEPYFDNGREELMRRMAKESNYTIVGADCSGYVVGLWINAKVVSSGFDASADQLYGSYCVQTKNPQPGDLAHRPGHIGICVAPNWIVESVGGAYGVQLTKRTDRRVIDFRDHSIHKMSKWSNFGDPKVY